jgi:hypothetical protein
MALTTAPSSRPISAADKERVQLYLYSHSRSSWPVLGKTLPFTFTVQGADFFTLSKFFFDIGKVSACEEKNLLTVQVWDQIQDCLEETRCLL